MNKIPNEQLDLDFNTFQEPVEIRGNVVPPFLKIVSSTSEISGQYKKQVTEREKILSDVISYARSLSW